MIEGDSSFMRLNMKDDRGALAPGEYPVGENVRCRNKVAQTRRGVVMPPNCNTEEVTTIIGSGTYSNPNGTDCLLLALPGEVLQIKPNTSPSSVSIPAGVTLEAPIEFVQAFDKVLMFRGLNGIALVWDGLSSTGFVEVKKSDTDPTYTALIPHAVTAESYRSRILVPSLDERDVVAVSDVGNYSIYDKSLDSFRINAGTADTLVRVFPFGDQVLMFKGHSILSLANFTTEPVLAQLNPVNTSIGSCARKSVASVGKDVFFLSEPGGVYRITDVWENSLRAQPVPVSDLIQPIIDRINWLYASAAVASVHGEYYYLAVPLDESAVNNCLLVYNTVTEGWESVDSYNGIIAIDNLIDFFYLGHMRLFAIDHTNSAVYVLEEGKHDELKYGDVWPQFVFETRGYSTLPTDPQDGRRTILAHKNFRKTHIAIATWAPSYEVDVITDGVNEPHALTRSAITHDRTRHWTFGKPRFVITNEDEDFSEPLRRDYSVELSTGPGIHLGEGIALEAKQETVERYGFRAHGRWASYRITNTEGSLDVLAAGTEAEPAQANFRRAS